MFRATFIAFLVFASAGFANEKQALVHTMLTNSQNQFGDERHAVDVQDCTITTYRWKDHPETGWTLWSSFKFPINLAELPGVARSGNDFDYFVSVPGAQDRPESQTAIIVFSMTGQEQARFERSNLRKRPYNAKNSPRGDGTTHHYMDADRFFIVQQGPGVIAKARAFTNAYRTYAAHYCTFIG
ncbi:MAG: hypothetical protein AAGF56_10280 [Pseudomonadota bacterium]